MTTFYPQVSRELQELYDDQTTADITIFYGHNLEHRINAHKWILSTSSAGIARTLAADPKGYQLFLYGPPQAIRDVIRYMYTLPLDESFDRTPLHDLQIWDAAHIHHMPTLVEMIEKRLEINLRLCSSMSFTNVLRAVYQFPRYSGLPRRVVSEVCGARFSGCMSNEGFQKVLQEIPELAIDLLKEIASHIAIPKPEKKTAVRGRRRGRGKR